MKKIFKVEAQGDTLYLYANNERIAKERLFSIMGPIPENLLTFTQVDAAPDDEEVM